MSQQLTIVAVLYYPVVPVFYLQIQTYVCLFLIHALMVSSVLMNLQTEAKMLWRHLKCLKQSSFYIEDYIVNVGTVF